MDEKPKKHEKIKILQNNKINTLKRLIIIEMNFLELLEKPQSHRIPLRM